MKNAKFIIALAIAALTFTSCHKTTDKDVTPVGATPTVNTELQTLSYGNTVTMTVRPTKEGGGNIIAKIGMTVTYNTADTSTTPDVIEVRVNEKAFYVKAVAQRTPNVMFSYITDSTISGNDKWNVRLVRGNTTLLEFNNK